MTYQSDLIFDLGMHRGEDTDFYLKKGFRVVAIDANLELCTAAAQLFSDAVRERRLTILNLAIAETEGNVAFFRNSRRSEWGTVLASWAQRNESKGAPSDTTIVRACTLADIVATHGVPYFVKIDIEGLDTAALRTLARVADRPKFVSIESEKVSFDALVAEFELFRELGYDRFKAVPQHLVRRQRLPEPAREGLACTHRFAKGSSGLFGEEAPGRWLSATEALAVYRRIFARYRWIGDGPALHKRVLRQVAGVVGARAGWYDTHALLSGE